MVTEITIPKLGLTMEEAKLVKWSFDTGQAVAAKQMVALIETDKVSFEIVSPANGIVYPVVPAGTTVLVAQIIGYIAADEAELAILQKEHPVDAGVLAEHSEDKPGGKLDKTAPAATDTAGSKVGERIISSPLARRMAKEHGLDLAKIPGTGPGGRIVEVDIQQALAAPPQIEPVQALEVPASIESDLALTVAEEIPIQGIRKVIFQNMHLSLNTQA
ncbi:MAG: E3 binding domain-containing protein, partial [Proteobacteria bacterium]|nr:E3 binding domain-containing protein [Pseudomonadota bacterium]